MQPIATPLLVGPADSSFQIREDSLIAQATQTPDTVMRPAKSTTIALLSSMILPGAGQIYNGAYWKPPIIWGFGYYFWSVYHQQDKLFRQHQQLYAESVLADTVFHVGDANEKSLRDFYQSQKETFGVYLVLTYLVNVVDAYVDASLYNFEVSPNLQPTTKYVGMNVRIHF
jgi:Family of unknown function (DUF5683)